LEKDEAVQEEARREEVRISEEGRGEESGRKKKRRQRRINEERCEGASEMRDGASRDEGRRIRVEASTYKGAIRDLK
jgi:hypothetical protein